MIIDINFEFFSNLNLIKFYNIFRSISFKLYIKLLTNFKLFNKSKKSLLILEFFNNLFIKSDKIIFKKEIFLKHYIYLLAILFKLNKKFKLYIISFTKAFIYITKLYHLCNKFQLYIFIINIFIIILVF